MKESRGRLKASTIIAGAQIVSCSKKHGYHLKKYSILTDSKQVLSPQYIDDYYNHGYKHRQDEQADDGPDVNGQRTLCGLVWWHAFSVHVCSVIDH